MIMCVLLCYPVSIRIYYQQGGLFLVSPSLLVLWLQNVKTEHEKSWPANILPEKNFGLILKNKIGAIANYFKILKML